MILIISNNNEITITEIIKCSEEKDYNLNA